VPALTDFELRSTPLEEALKDADLVLIVTALVIAARIAVGPLAAAVTGVVGVLVAILVLILTGYARIPPISRTRH